MLKSYKYRIYPTEDQKPFIKRQSDACRFIYNLALETRIYAYKSLGVTLSYFDLTMQLTGLKTEFTWLNDFDRKTLENSIKNMNSAFIKFFNGAGYPKFKHKGSVKSFRCREGIKVDFENGYIKVPKISNLKAVISKKFEGKVNAVTISKTETDKYYASVLVDNSIELPKKQPIDSLNTIGIDLGLKDFLITDTGIKIANPKYLKQSIERLKVLQRRASKKKKGSNNRKKANLCVSIQHEKITNKRNDFLQKLSTQLVRDSQATTFCMENLAVKNLVKNHNLAQAISDVSWFEFIRQMKYKCEWTGKSLIQIGRFEPTTKTCNNCGFINTSLTLNDREWFCECGATHDRDINAAINIKNIALKNSGWDTSGESVEQRTIVRAKKQKINVNITGNKINK